MPQIANIKELVKGAQAGEEYSWNALYRYFYPGLYATALHLSHNPAAAKDHVQEAFMVAFLKLSQLRDLSAFGSWIKKILLHCYFRAAQAAEKYVKELPVQSEQWWENDFENKLEFLSRQSKLHALVTQLPETLRSAVLLRYFSAFHSYEQIANVLCVPVGTIRSRLNQAKSKLAEYWQKYKDFEPDVFKASEEWNHFYTSTLAGLHHHQDCKDRFMHHLQSDVYITLPMNKLHSGRSLFDAMVIEDQEFGSWLMPENIVSCGNISVVDIKHFNSSEHPHHCPFRSVMVLYRNKEKVNKMQLHIEPS